jgi:hypothetical protein
MRYLMTMLAAFGPGLVATAALLLALGLLFVTSP